MWTEEFLRRNYSKWSTERKEMKYIKEKYEGKVRPKNHVIGVLEKRTWNECNIGRIIAKPW